MSEEITTTTTDSTETNTAQPAPSAPPPMQMALGMSAEQVSVHTDAVKRAASAEAQLKAEHEKLAALDAAKNHDLAAQQATATQAQLDDLNARNTALLTQVRRSKAMQALPGIRDVETFLPLVEGLVVLDPNNNLTEESRTAITEWAKARPYLFEETKGIATTPQAGAGHLPADGSFTAEEMKMFNQIGVTPGAYKNTPAWKKIGWIFGHDSRKGN